MSESAQPIEPPSPPGSPSPLPTGAPDRASRRIPSLDVLRGIAILGTLASNIWIFTQAVGYEANGPTPPWLAEFGHWVPNGKFLGLLTIMFGIGLEIQRQAARRAGRPWPGTYLVRMGLLFLDGLLNYIFVFPFDVLRAYAVTGFVVAFLVLTSERVQWWLIGIALSLNFIMLSIMASVGQAELRALEAREAAASSTAAPAGGVEDPTYGDFVSSQVLNIGEGFGHHSEFITIIFLGTGLFLLGAKLYRIGIFEPHRRTLRYWFIGIGVFVGIPLDWALAFLPLSPLLEGYSRYGSAALVALGILGAVAEFYQNRAPGRMGRQLAILGKMALSIYLLQNIIGVVFQNNIASLPVFATMDRVLCTVVTFGLISVVLIVFARLWLSRFRRGPFETVWEWGVRKLTGTKG